jgi:hypothetical protein
VACRLRRQYTFIEEKHLRHSGCRYLEALTAPRHRDRIGMCRCATGLGSTSCSRLSIYIYVYLSICLSIHLGAVLGAMLGGIT